MNRKNDFSSLQQKIEYTFNNHSLLLTAFTHCSFANESEEECQTNERMEFLGDAVLNLIATNYLFSRYQDLAEGDLTKIRSRIVDTNACFYYANILELYKYLRLGKGEQTIQGDARGKKNILADLFEALIGAIYLDGGIICAEKFFKKHLEQYCDIVMSQPCENWKAQLQELCQTNSNKKMLYILLDESGPDHQKKYIYGVSFDDIIIGKGSGNSKKQAQQSAAKEGFHKLKNDSSMK